MRAARPTISSIWNIVERAPLTRRYRATLSQWERAERLNSFEYDDWLFDQLGWGCRRIVRLI